MAGTGGVVAREPAKRTVIGHATGPAGCWGKEIRLAYDCPDLASCIAGPHLIGRG